MGPMRTGKAISCKYINTGGYSYESLLLYDTSCLGDENSFYATFKHLQHLLRTPLELYLSNISIMKQLS